MLVLRVWISSPAGVFSGAPMPPALPGARPRARRVLRRVAAFENTVLFGERLHITLPRAGFDAEAAAWRVRDAGVSIEHWQVREPSLEDVFLAYTSKPAASGQRQGEEARP